MIDIWSINTINCIFDNITNMVIIYIDHQKSFQEVVFGCEIYTRR